MVDLHCHILPGIDDGAKNIEESLSMLRKAALAGVQTVVATPHFIRMEYDLEPSKRDKMISELQNVTDERKIEIKIKPGYECFLTPELLEGRFNLADLTINSNGKYILVELPMHNIPLYAEEVLFRINSKGIIPVIAHPERNMDICKKPKILFDFVEKGYVSLLSASSLMGYFGSSIKKASRVMITNNLIHAVASDMHSPRSNTIDVAFPIIEYLLGNEKAINLFVNNPQKILNGETFNRDIPKCPKSGMIGLMSIFSRRRVRYEDEV